jgi:hypothetical protein
MTDLNGDAVLALWNGVEAARVQEYDLWHTREHVPERLGVPGILHARRYEQLDGPLPQFLTLYDLETIGVLTSPPYRRLLENPTAWSRSMRPGFRGFMRLCCRRALSGGGGLGGWLLATVVDDIAGFDTPAGRTWLTRLIEEPAVVAAHLLCADPAVPEVPFSVSGAAPAFPRAGAILVESYSAEALAQSRSRIEAAFADLGAGKAAQIATVYRLAYALDRSAAPRCRAPARAT